MWPNIFHGNPGPVNVKSVECPGDAFKLFFIPEMMQEVVRNANEFAISEMPNFKPVKFTEIYKFIGCQVFIGIFQAKQEKLDEIWSEELWRPFFQKTFSLNRFRDIKKSLRTDDRRKRILFTQWKRLDPIRDFCEAFI